MARQSFFASQRLIPNIFVNCYQDMPMEVFHAFNGKKYQQKCIKKTQSTLYKIVQKPSTSSNLYVCLCHCKFKTSVSLRKIYKLPVILFRYTIDFGYETNKDALPIQQLRFGGQSHPLSKAKYSIGDIRCAPYPFGMNLSTILY